MNFLQLKNVLLNCECVPAEGEGAGGRLKASEVMSCECLLNWWGILETGSTSWGGWYKNSETHDYCKCTLSTAASVVTVSADLHTMFSSLHLLNLDLSLKNKQQGGLYQLLRMGGTIEHTQLQPWTALLALPMTLYTHWCLIQSFPAHMTDFSPRTGLFTLLQKHDESRWRPVMFYAAVQMSSTAFHGTDVVQRSWGWEQTQCQWGKWGNELKNVGLLQQSPWTFHLPRGIMMTPRCLKNTHIYPTV